MGPWITIGSCDHVVEHADYVVLGVWRRRIHKDFAEHLIRVRAVVPQPFDFSCQRAERQHSIGLKNLVARWDAFGEFFDALDIG
jgi:hypothetical protein